MDFESTANELTKVSEKGLSSVSSLCKKQLELEDRVKALKAELKETEQFLREMYKLKGSDSGFNMGGLVPPEKGPVSNGMGSLFRRK